MKKYSYAKLISLSWDWMATILFRPFNLKKWIMLGIIAILAGQLQFGGGNCNFKSSPKKGCALPKLSSQTQISMANFDSIEDFKNNIFPIAQSAIQTLRKNMTLVSLIILSLISIIITMLLWACIKSIFSFIFIENLVKNDASVRIPFHKNKGLGFSYFRWNIFFGALVTTTFVALITLSLYSIFRSGGLSLSGNLGASALWSVIKPFAASIGLVIALFVLIWIFAGDFIPVIMYTRKIGVIKAWGIFFKFFIKNFFELILYLLVKLGLGILAIVAFILLALLALLMLLLSGGALMLVGFLIQAITPLAAKSIVMIILGFIGVPVFVFLAFLASLIILPIPIFFKYFSIHFLGSVDSSLDAFAKCTEELEANEDLAKYKKPLALLWATILSPFISMAIIMAIFFFGGSIFAKTAFPELPITPGTHQIEPQTTEEAPPLQNIIKKDLVTVFLKNGQYFEAEITKETSDNITFSVDGGTFTINKKDVKSISREK